MNRKKKYKRSLSRNRSAITGRTAMEMFTDEKKLLWQYSGPLACSDSVQLRVDKYATISYCTNRYSVSDKLVGCFVDVKVFSNKIEAYNQNTLVASHQRNYGKHQWIISLEHYLGTLKKKPGALEGSVALTSSPYLKKLYLQFYTDAPRDFIDLLHYCGQNKISAENWKPPCQGWLAFAPRASLQRS